MWMVGTVAIGIRDKKFEGINKLAPLFLVQELDSFDMRAVKKRLVLG